MSIKRNFIYNSVLTSANYIFPFITYPYISRILGVENIGKCNFVDNVIFCFVIIGTLGVDLVGTREIAQNHGAARDKVFTGLITINGLTILFSLISLYVCILFVDKFTEYNVLLLIGSFRLLFSFLSVNWLFQGLENFKFVTIRTIIVRTLFVILVFLLVNRSDDYIVYFILLTSSFVVNGIINIYFAKKEVRFCFDRKITRQLIRPVFYMGIYSITCWLYNSFGIVCLGLLTTDTEVGNYTTATKLYSIFLSLFSAFSAVMLPRLSSLTTDNNNDLKSLVNSSFDIVLTCTVPLAIFVISYSGEIVHLISGSGYEGAILPMQLVMPLLIIVGVSQIVIMQILMPFKKDKQILIATICGAFLGVILNVVLIPYAGSKGAAISWVLSEFFVLIVAYSFVKRFTKLSLSFKTLYQRLLGGIPYGIVIVLVRTVITSESYLQMIVGALSCFIVFCVIHFWILKNEMLIGIVKSFKL